MTSDRLSERVAERMGYARVIGTTADEALIRDLDAERLRLEAVQAESDRRLCVAIGMEGKPDFEEALNCIDGMHDEIESLRTKLREAEVDAGRYRWLRDESYREPNAPGPIYRSLYDGIKGRADTLDLRRVWLRYGNALDAAIDAAIAAAKEGK